MDEVHWALQICKDTMLLCKETGDPQSMHDFKEENIETMHQHISITDISHSFMEDAGGQFNHNSNTNNSTTINNNNVNINDAYTKAVHQRLGLNGLCRSINQDGEEFIDLDSAYQFSSLHNNYPSNRNNHLSHNHHHNHHHHQNSPPNQHHHHHHHSLNNHHSSILSSQSQEQLSHQFNEGDHNHYHLLHTRQRLEYDANSSLSNYNTGDTSSNSSSISLNSVQRNHDQNTRNNSNPRNVNTNINMRRNVDSTSIIRQTTSNNFHPQPHYLTQQSTTAQYKYRELDGGSDTDIKKSVAVKDEEEEPTPYPPKRRPGRPRGSRRKKPEKLGRLWEFIRDLLLNPESCPSLICWDNYEEGMFRFVHSDKVAKLWGEKRDNPEMNYEKLSRAMRYYYKSNVLQPVFGRRLVYKFGPEARGWKTENPNFTC